MSGSCGKYNDEDDGCYGLCPLLHCHEHDEEFQACIGCPGCEEEELEKPILQEVEILGGKK